MFFYIIFGLLYVQSAEVLDYHCAICMERVPNVKYIHPIGTHFAVCSDCDTRSNFGDCPVCQQSINNREVLDEHQKEALKKKIRRRKKQEKNAQEALTLNQQKEAEEREKEADRKKELANSLLPQAVTHIDRKEDDEAFAILTKIVE